MSNDEKLAMLMSLLGAPVCGSSSNFEETLKAYLTAAEKEILAWRYSYSAQSVDSVPPEYEMTQIYAVIAGYSQSGAEGQMTHSENGIARTFKYPDMIRYIRTNVIPLCGVM